MSPLPPSTIAALAIGAPLALAAEGAYLAGTTRPRDESFAEAIRSDLTVSAGHWMIGLGVVAAASAYFFPRARTPLAIGGSFAALYGAYAVSRPLAALPPASPAAPPPGAP